MRRERHPERMKTAGEGRDVIAELPLDPVSYKTHRRTGLDELSSVSLGKQSGLLPPPSTATLRSYGWATEHSLLWRGGGLFLIDS